MLPYPFNEEIKGIASASDVPLGQGCSFFAQTVFVCFVFIFFMIMKNVNSGNKTKSVIYSPLAFLKSLTKSSSSNFLGEVVLFNIFYEVFTVCTSVVTEDLNGNLNARHFFVLIWIMTYFVLPVRLYNM